MSNGIASAATRVLSAFLAASLVSLSACDSGLSPPAQHKVTAGFLDPSDNGRQRDDPARQRVWILNSRGVFLYHTATGKLVEVSLPSWQWVDGPYACPPDLALGPHGEAVVTSNVVPTLWRIDPRTLNVSVHEIALDADNNKDVGFSALLYSARHGVYFAVSEVHGSVWRIDPSLRQGRKTALSGPMPETCEVPVPRGAE